MDKLEYQKKPYYLENHVVREPCKQKTACITLTNMTMSKFTYGTVLKNVACLIGNIEYHPLLE